MRLVRYIRVSKVAGRAGDSFQSPQQQRKAIDAIVSLTPNARIVAEFEDMDESGGTMNRPGVQRAIEMVEIGQADGIVVAYLDRWARTLEALEMIERWAAQGKTLISARERFDATTSQGKFALGMMLLVAKYYRDQVTERWDDSVRDAIGRGVHTVVPYGYRRSNGKGSPLVIEPDESATVRRIYAERMHGTSDSNIARGLNADAIPAAKGGRWTRQAIRALIRSKVYMGTAHKGPHELAGAHEAIVSADEWRAAQKPAGEPTQNGRYLLSGLARCGCCGFTLTGGYSGREYRYRCYTAHRSTFRCEHPVSTSAAALEALVADAFLARYGDIRMQAASGQSLAAATEATLARTRDEYERWRDDAEMRTAIGDEDYRAGLLARKRALNDAERDHADALRESNAATLNISDDIWGALDTSERRGLMREGMDAVVVRRARSTRSPLAERVDLVWAGELDHDGTTGGIAGAVRSRTHP